MEQSNINQNFVNKMSEFDDKVEKLFENLNALSMEIKLKIISQNPQIVTTQAVFDPKIISKEDANSANLYFEFTEYKLKFESLTKDYEGFKKNYKSQNQVQQIQQLIANPGEKKEKIVRKEILTNTKNEELDLVMSKIDKINEQIFLLKDKNIIVDYNMDSKVSKEDIDKINKQMTLEFEKFQLKLLNDNSGKNEGKNNKNIQNSPNLEKDELVKKKKLI